MKTFVTILIFLGLLAVTACTKCALDNNIASSGKSVTINYTGTLQSTGKKFDSSLDRSTPLTFRLGDHRVIAGLEKGIEGMKPGEKRKLTIPPEQAYGSEGLPPVIPPNSTLVFDVEVLSVKEP